MDDRKENPVTAAAVVDGLRREQARLRTAVDAFGSAATTVPVTEDGPAGWTAKDVLGHLVHYASQIAFGLGAALQPPSYVLSADGRLTAQEWNDRAVAFWRPASLDEVWDAFDRAVDAIVSQVQRRDDAELAAEASTTIPWAPPGPLWRFVGWDTFLGEWPAHATQIEEASRNLTP